MATYVYGPTISMGTFNFRSFMAYTVSSTNTSYSMTILAGAQVTGTNNEVGWNNLSVSVSCTGKTAKTVTTNYRTSKADSSHRQTFVSSFTWSWNRGESSTATTYNVSAKLTVPSYGTSTASYSLKVQPLASYTISYNANSATSGSVPSSQTKYYGKSTTLRTNSGNLAKTNYQFLGWNTTAAGTGTSYAAGGTYTANASATLYANWKLVYSKPTINNLACYRVNSQDERLDAGTYIHVQFEYQCGHTGDTVYAPTCVITIGNTTVYNASLANPPSPFSMVFGSNYDPDSDYTVTVKLSDSQDSTGITKSAVVKVATYPIDLITDGQSVYMGIMHPAVNGQAVTSKDLNVDGTLKIGGVPLEVTTPSVSVSATTGTLSGAYVRQYGKIVQLSITFQSSSSVASGSNVFTGTLNTTALRPLIVTTSGTYFGAHAIMGMLNQSGAITVRNASSTAVQISGASTGTVSFTYIVA